MPVYYYVFLSLPLEPKALCSFSAIFLILACKGGGGRREMGGGRWLMAHGQWPEEEKDDDLRRAQNSVPLYNPLSPILPSGHEPSAISHRLLPTHTHPRPLPHRF